MKISDFLSKVEQERMSEEIILSWPESLNYRKSAVFRPLEKKKTQFYISRYFFFKYSIINIHILAIFWRGDLIDDSVPTTLQYNKWISMRVLIAELVCLISIFVSF